MDSSKVFIDLMVDDEAALNAIASGAQCTVSKLDSERPLLQVLAVTSLSIEPTKKQLSRQRSRALQVGTQTLFGTWKFTVNPTRHFLPPPPLPLLHV